MGQILCEILQNCVVWWIGVGKVRGILLLAKAKSSKNFLILHCRIEGGFAFLCVRFGGFMESRGNCRICGMDSVES